MEYVPHGGRRRKYIFKTPYGVRIRIYRCGTHMCTEICERDVDKSRETYKTALRIRIYTNGTYSKLSKYTTIQVLLYTPGAEFYT